MIEQGIDEDMAPAKKPVAENENQQTQKKCTVSFESVDVGYGMFLVGHAFMSKYYTVFDRQNNRVGLAQAKE